MTGTTTWKQNTITDERALARFFDPQVIFQVQNRLHLHRSWRTTTRPSITREPKQHPQSAELSITSWNPDTLNHGKLERFLTYFDADVIKKSRRKIEDAHDTKRRESQGRHNHFQSGQNGAQEDIKSFRGAGVLGNSAIMHAECSSPFERRLLELDRSYRGTIRRGHWQAAWEESG